MDLDLGNYERYLNVTLNRDNNITTGKVYREVIDKEASHSDGCALCHITNSDFLILQRRGDYLGKTVQVRLKYNSSWNPGSYQSAAIDRPPHYGCYTRLGRACFQDSRRRDWRGARRVYCGGEQLSCHSNTMSSSISNSHPIPNLTLCDTARRNCRRH